MDMFEYRLNMYRNNPQSENMDKAIQVFNYLKNDIIFFLRETKITPTAFNVLAYLANIDGIVTNSEISFLSDFLYLTEYKLKPGITPAQYLRAFKDDENEKVLLNFANQDSSIKEDLQILGMIMYTYDGSMPSKKKVEFLKKLEC